MDPQDAIDFSREALKTCLIVGGPILLASLLIGLVISVFQAMTQLHDQTISFVPKIILLLLTIAVCLPWLTDHMLEFAKTSFEKPMGQPTSSFGFSQISNSPAFVPPGAGPHDKVAFRGSRRSDRFANLPHKPVFSKAQHSTPAIARPATLKPRVRSPFELPSYQYTPKPRRDKEG